MIVFEYEPISKCYDCREGKKEDREIKLIYSDGEPGRYYCNNEKQDCSKIITLNKTLELKKRIDELEKKIE